MPFDTFTEESLGSGQVGYFVLVVRPRFAFEKIVPFLTIFLRVCNFVCLSRHVHTQLHRCVYYRDDSVPE